MIVSIEPGYYETNAFGIRLENLYYIKPCTPPSVTSVSDDVKFLQFESLTYVPFQKNFVNFKMFSSHHIDWWNTYHQQVYEKLSDHLTPSSSPESSLLLEWLQDVCSPIQE